MELLGKLKRTALRCVYRVERDTGEITDDLSWSKILGNALVAFAILRVGLRLWHLFHGHSEHTAEVTDFALEVLFLAAFGGTLITRAGDFIDVALDAAQEKYGSDDETA